MQSTIEPAAEVLWDAVGTVVSLEGTEEIAPRNDEEWARVRNNALTLAESGNLLMIGDRAQDTREWIRMSQALIDAAGVALKAAEAKNPEALFDAGGEVYQACRQCHLRYWKESRQD